MYLIKSEAGTIALFAAFIAVGIFGIVQAVDLAINMPSVLFSNKTRQCVQVIDYRESKPENEAPWSCENMPKKFNMYWVE